jgi:hypothetical protein
MAGPLDRVPLESTVESADLDWVVGYRSEVVDDATGEKMGDEFFCHSQLQLPGGNRLFVTATGIEEIRFPEGFAMPVSQILQMFPEDARSLSMLGMVLNNHEQNIDRHARVRTTIEYLTEDDLAGKQPPKALYKAGLPVTVEDLATHTAIEPAPEEDVSTHCVLVDGLKSHWLVPPGPQITRRRHTGIVPVESTVHYAVVHLHNYAKYLRLTDVTTGKLLWQTDVVYEPDRVQIEEIPKYSSAEGFTVYPDHVYEVEAYYENTAGQDVDAMAGVELFFHPKGKVPTTAPAA